MEGRAEMVGRCKVTLSNDLSRQERPGDRVMGRCPPPEPPYKGELSPRAPVGWRSVLLSEKAASESGTLP